jgi:hypothetical protein
MCEIQFIKKLEGKMQIEDLRGFFKAMMFGSEHNDDAFGIISKDYICKAPGGFNPYLINWKKLIASDFIVGHNRFATNRSSPGMNVTDFVVDAPILPVNGFTIWNPVCLTYACTRYFSGKQVFDKKEDDAKEPNEKEYNENINNHPFRIGDLILVHNGVISNYAYLARKYLKNANDSPSTDSYILLNMIDRFFNKSLEKDRHKRLVAAIKKAYERIEGSLSVFLYDSKTKRIYYFKNCGTSFSFHVINHNILIGSTEEENLAHMYSSIKHRRDFRIKDNRLYEIGDNVNQPIKYICKLSDDEEDAPWWSFKDRVKVKKKSKLKSSNKTTERFKYLKYIPKWLR